MKFWKSIKRGTLEDGSVKASGRSVEEEKDIIFIYKGQSKKQYPKDFTHVTIHSSMRKIRKEAFQNAQSLYSITIPPKVKTICQSAFEECQSLVLVEFYDGLEHIEYAAFRSCRSLLGMYNEDRTTLVIPSSVHTIGDHAFFSCISLTHVQFHQGLQSIGRAAFSGCRWIVGIDLPVGLLRIRNSAFSQCKALQHISIPATVEAIEDGAFQYCSALANVELQEGLKSVGSAAFAGCSTLSAIRLPSSLEKIGCRAFLDCTNLVGIEFPGDLCARFEEDCFAHCNALVNVSLPASVKDAPDKVFASSEVLQMGQALYLRERFEHYPLHRICYYASVTTIYDLILAFDAYDSNVLRDKFGMTPFHIVATSSHPREEILRSLLDRYPLEALEYKDNNGKTMLDYMMIHSSSKAVPLIQMVLKRAIVERLSDLGLGEKWVSSLLGCLELLGSDHDTETRRLYVRDSFFGEVGSCLRLEAISLMELALWKTRMKAFTKAEIGTSVDDHRRVCRFQSGAGVVIANVTEYLWSELSKQNTAIAIFQKIVPSLKIDA